MTGHAVFRSWCKICLAVRSRAPQHRLVDHSRDELPEVSMDYCYLPVGGDEEAWELLVLRDRDLAVTGCTLVRRKGPEPYSVGYISGFLTQLGWKRVVLKSDNEHSLVRLAEESASYCTTCECVPRRSPEGDHAANGAIEVMCQEVKMTVRCLRQLEARCGSSIPLDSAIASFAPRFAASCMNRYRVNVDGRTGYQRLYGKAFRKPVI